MVYIPIKISDASENTSVLTFFAGTIGALLFGIGIGVFISLRLPLHNPAQITAQLGAVGETAPEVVSSNVLLGQQATEVASMDEGAVLGAQDESVNIPNDEAVLVVAPSREEVLLSIEIEISTRIFAIDRLTKEIELVKNDSVFLISEFNQNCANWNDACAEPYRMSLEKNNASYENLLARLNTLTTELNNAKESQALLLAQ